MAGVWCQTKPFTWTRSLKPHSRLRLLTQIRACNHCSRLGRLPIRMSIPSTQHRLLLEQKIHFSLITTTARQSLTKPLHRSIHTTCPRKLGFPPFLWLFIKPIGKVSAMFGGRSLRRWWAKIPDHKRQSYMRRFGGRSGIVFTLVALISVAICIHYYIHLETNPLTGRTRFICFNKEQIATITEITAQDLLKGQVVVGGKDARYKAVADCCSTIVNAIEADHEMMENLNWTVTVIDDDSTSNACVLPDGRIFVYTGLLKQLDNIDQLAIVLGHEIAHAVMGHSVESISRAQVIDFVVIAVLAAFWAFVPGDGIALITQWFYHKLIMLMLELPFSRELEMEADTVGLQFAAKACYDVREAPALWALLDATKKYSQSEENVAVDFLSTHPSDESRSIRLLQALPQALKMREDCKCCRLDAAQDPMQRVAKEITKLKADFDMKLNKPSSA